MADLSTTLNSHPNIKTAQDWVRQLRFSSNVNKQTVGVQTDRVTPQLLLGSSKRLLGISKGEAQGDMKDALQFQRVYGPVEYFAQRIQKDGGSVARSMLWKATTKGNLDFIGSGSLQPHISAVFNQSNLSQFIDNSTPLDGIDNSLKVTRIGEGGVQDDDSVPIQMRLVQPSYYGYIDPVRTQDKSPGVTGYLTKNVLKGTDGKLYQKFINTKTGKEQYVDSQKAASSVVTTNQYLNTKDKYVYAMGGSKGVRIVPAADVQYILPRNDDIFSTCANLVPMISGNKGLRLNMGCLHPEAPVLIIDKEGFTDIVPAKRLASIENAYLFGCTDKGIDKIYPLKNVVTRLADRKRGFYNITLDSGRYLPTSPDHKWYIYEEGKFKKVTADKLKPGMLVPRSLFSSMPVRSGSIMGKQITREICVLLGRLIRSLKAASYSYKFTYIVNKEEGVDQTVDIEAALKQLDIKQYNFFRLHDQSYVSIKDSVFIDWIDQNIGNKEENLRIPKEILSLPKGYTSIFLDSFYKDLKTMGEDVNGDVWLIKLPNDYIRDGISLMLSKIYTNTKYRDTVNNKGAGKALQLGPLTKLVGDIVLQKIVGIHKVAAPAVMIDIDCDDNVYAVGNGIITHNSKYGTQAVPLEGREAPLVRGLDELTGMDMPTKLGKLLGTQWAQKDGMVKAVREDRIDMLYDDGTTGSVPLYKDFPANAKGWLSNYVQVKAGQKVKKGQLLASSNYTDNKGVLAMGRNLRLGYLSYHGGTYEDACTISQSAAKSMGYTTMYKTDMDKDKSIRNSKYLYKTWKPGQYSKQQMQKLDDDGVIKVGSIISKGDPVILGIQTTQPSPGTLGKRLLSDVTQTWEHAHDGIVTDVVNTKKGIKVFAKVTAPLQPGDKISGMHGNKATIAQIIPDEQMPRDEKGRPLQVLFDPLGIISRCYDKQTQFLTKEGWKLGKDIADNEQLYSYDAQKNTCHWSKQIQPMYKKNYIGPMYGVKTKAMQFLVTPGHRFFARTTDVFSQVTVQEIYNKDFELPAIAPSDYTQYIPSQIFVKQTQYKQASHSDWYTVQYNDMVYCPTVDTGYVVTRRNGKVIIAHNTNPSQMIQSGLGKVAAKLGQPVVVPQFMPAGQSRIKYAKDLMKKHNVPWKETVYDPQSNRNIKNVFTGVQYFLPLKHIADTKMSSRGTESYTSEQVPASGGQHGCFPAFQRINTKEGLKTIQQICTNKLDIEVMSFSKGLQFKKITDWFIYEARKCDILDIVVDIGHCKAHIYPTKNHNMYKTDMTKVLAQELKVGDKLKILRSDKEGIIISIEIMQNSTQLIPVYDFTVADNHNYFLAGGILVSNSKRIGNLETAALVGHNAFDFLTTDAKLIRGQSNADFWRSIRTGQIPTVPGEPLVHKKFFASLQAAGMNIKRDNTGVSIMSLTNSDVKQLANNREVKSADTYEQKSFRPIAGGLFGEDIFGSQGTSWGYIQLDEPLPNPVMQQPLARLLGLSDNQFQSVIKGQKQINGMKGPNAIKEALQKIDLQKEAAKALKELKEASPSKKDAAIKKYVAIGQMRDNGVHPSQYMLDRIPVLPAVFRPISSHGGLTMVSDSNYLYAQLIHARDDVRESKGLPSEYQQKAKANVYQKWKELVGVYQPSDVKLKNKNVKGLLKWICGKSPKFSAYHQKVLGSTVDTVGRGVVIPSTKVNLDQIAMPIEMAWDVYAPFVTRKLVQADYSPVDALKMVKQKSPKAIDALKAAIAERPVVMNRAPSLHKLSLAGFNVKLTKGHAIKVNPSVVAPFAMDFDGDSCKSLISAHLQLPVPLNSMNPQNNSLEIPFLTNEGVPCRIQVNTNNLQRKDSNMIAEGTKIELAHTVMELADLPRLEETKVEKSPTVTEWDVKPGMYANTIDPETGNITLAPITKVSKHTNLEMVEVEMAISGAYSHVVTSSIDHSLITYNTMTMNLEKTKPEDAVGRCVPMTRVNIGNCYDKEERPLAAYITFSKGKLPLSYDLGLFFGLMIGDGWVSVYKDTNKVGAMYLSCCEPSLQKAISDLSKKSSVPLTKEASLCSYKADEQRFSKDDMQRFTLYADDTDKELILKLIGHGAQNKKIPAICLMASKAHMIGILMGLLATDGSISHNPPTGKKKSAVKHIAYHTTSPILRDGVQELAKRLGVKTSATVYTGTTSGNTAYMVNFCLEDMVRLYKSNPSKFIIPVDYKQEAMERIAADIHENAKASCNKAVTSYDIVPFPRGLFCEFSWAKFVDISKDAVVKAREKGYIKRSVALRIAEALERRDWSIYKTPTYIKVADRTNRSAEEAKALVDKWIDMVRDENIGWETVDKVTPSTVTEGWDCTVPGPYTFALSTGTIVQDTVNLHVPVSKKAVQNVRQYMMPSKNLISMRKNKILYKPQKAYVQGLYVASRMGQTKDVKTFQTMKDAQKAYRDGIIDIDTPIVIKEK